MRAFLIGFFIGLSLNTAIGDERGYTTDGKGNYYGTGKNFGSGWQTDQRGGFYGTGKNFGKRCVSDNRGGIRCSN